jgi:hypothetical protein
MPSGGRFISHQVPKPIHLIHCLITSRHITVSAYHIGSHKGRPESHMVSLFLMLIM